MITIIAAFFLGLITFTLGVSISIWAYRSHGRGVILAKVLGFLVTLIAFVGLGYLSFLSSHSIIMNDEGSSWNFPHPLMMNEPWHQHHMGSSMPFMHMYGYQPDQSADPDEPAKTLKPQTLPQPHPMHNYSAPMPMHQNNQDWMMHHGRGHMYMRPPQTPQKTPTK
ncbi:MAG: hypothetical protein KC505_03365 [Myxococcales bacterium]|nr:hypothetical protein [Myxococcales bacterium]USN50694.1 MAG: hypothetical protein H6731_10625 [Myxococcales bacterium]